MNGLLLAARQGPRQAAVTLNHGSIAATALDCFLKTILAQTFGDLRSFVLSLDSWVAHYDLLLIAHTRRWLLIQRS